MQFVANLHFTGTCREAIALYQAAFGAKVHVLVTQQDCAGDHFTPRPGEEHYIWHAELAVGEQGLLLNDCTDTVYNAQPAVSVCVLM